jgi:hypothetical protein
MLGEGVPVWKSMELALAARLVLDAAGGGGGMVSL